MGLVMKPIVVLLFFFVKGHAIGVLPVASVDQQSECQQAGAAAIMANAGKEPELDGIKATPVPLCLDTRQLAEALLEHEKPKVKHEDGTVTL